MAVESSGVDWPAWVQAVGSVLAIGAAIWIDQGAARRLRAERRAEFQQAIDSRLDAISNCAASLEPIVELLKLWESSRGEDGPPYFEPDTNFFDIPESAGDTVRFYLAQQATEIDALLVSSLAQANHRYSSALSRFRRKLPIAGAAATDEGIALLEFCIAELRQVVKTYEHVRPP